MIRDGEYENKSRMQHSASACTRPAPMLSSVGPCAEDRGVGGQEESFIQSDEVIKTDSLVRGTDAGQPSGLEEDPRPARTAPLRASTPTLVSLHTAAMPLDSSDRLLGLAARSDSPHEARGVLPLPIGEVGST